MKYFFTLLILAVSMTAQPAKAKHGLLKELTTYWSQWALIFDVINKQRINYCLDIVDPRFDDESINLQTLYALTLWELPMQELGLTHVDHIRVSCESGDLDLKITIDAAKVNPARAPYQVPLPGIGDHKYSQIFINTAFIGSDGMSYVDFKTLIPTGANLSTMLDQYSFTHPSTVRKLEDRWHLKYNRIFHSTYPLLIHELGHSFGMCDTYKGGLHLCDPAFTTASHPSSVMRDVGYLYLTEDDRLGIQALYRRFKTAGKL